MFSQRVGPNNVLCHVTRNGMSTGHCKGRHVIPSLIFRILLVARKRKQLILA